VWLNADPVRLVQIIENLLNNAFKYTDAGGRIELIGESHPEFALIRVRDNGIGIEPELLPRVFELFTQSSRSLDRAQGGLGIGLTLVKRLVEMHDGEVSAHSDGPGLGATFVIRLPSIPSAEQIHRGGASRATPQGRRILVVDDNVGAAKMLSLLLTKLGAHQVDVAYDGETALSQIQRSHPEIVLLDIGLPSMDGYQVARAVRKQRDLDDVLLVALTGYGQEEDRQRSKESGFDLHLVKPVELAQLEGVIGRFQPPH
jgi:CheY-like chemotaxis protein/anti-sigma regulatory factor (Ser/Thr protein kinase)